jgi:hypothetical protein
MNFYVYRGHYPLGSEPLGTMGKSVWHDLKTQRGAIQRANRLYGLGGYKLYAFTNFYNNDTFREIR